jgi:hypothetical protein
VPTQPAAVFQGTKKNTVVLTAKLSKVQSRSFASAGITHVAEKLRAVNRVESMALHYTALR